MKRILAILTILICLVWNNALCEGESEVDKICAFGSSSSALLTSFGSDNVSIRAVYDITIPDESVDINELILNEYDSYERVTLVEYGFRRVGAIMQSNFVCIGTKSDGTMSLILTPFDIIGRTYDDKTFDGIIITPIDWLERKVLP